MIGAVWTDGLHAIFAAGPPTAAANRRMTRSGAAKIAAALCLGATITVARAPAALDSLWAEDGRVFLGGALRDEGFFVPYQGYLHLVPRTLMLVVEALPIRWAPAAVAVVSAAVTAFCAVFVTVAATAHVRSTISRILLGGGVVLLPLAGYEMLLNFANLHWYLMFASCWALLWTPATRRWQVAGSVLTLASAATNALSGLLVPLALARLVTTRGWAQRAPAASLLCGLAVQIAIVLTADGGVNPTGVPSAIDVGKVYATRIASPVFLGHRLAEGVFERYGWPSQALALTAFAVVCSLALRRSSSRPVVAVLLVLHLAFFFVPVVLRWHPLFLTSLSERQLDFSSRLMAIPLWLVWSAWAVAAGGQHRPRRARALVATTVVVTVGSAVIAADFASTGVRVTGPKWRAGLAAATRECDRGRDFSRILTAPENGEWYVDVPCERLRS